MTTVLLIIMLLSWVVLSLCILLMNPKWWLGFGIGWITSWNEYWTSKTVESKLKSIVTVAGIIFVISAIFYPYTKPTNETKINWLLNGGADTSSWAENAIDNLNLNNNITNTIQWETTQWSGIDTDLN